MVRIPEDATLTDSLFVSYEIASQSLYQIAPLADFVLLYEIVWYTER
jgi:hypothetical protein